MPDNYQRTQEDIGPESAADWYALMLQAEKKGNQEDFDTFSREMQKTIPSDNPYAQLPGQKQGSNMLDTFVSERERFRVADEATEVKRQKSFVKGLPPEQAKLLQGDMWKGYGPSKTSKTGAYLTSTAAGLGKLGAGLKNWLGLEGTDLYGADEKARKALYRQLHPEKIGPDFLDMTVADWGEVTGESLPFLLAPPGVGALTNLNKSAKVYKNLFKTLDKGDRKIFKEGLAPWQTAPAWMLGTKKGQMLMTGGGAALESKLVSEGEDRKDSEAFSFGTDSDALLTGVAAAILRAGVPLSGTLVNKVYEAAKRKLVGVTSEDKAQEILRQVITGLGDTTPQQAAEKYAELGPEAMLLDTSGTATGMADALASRMGADAEMIKGAVKERHLQGPGRALEAATESMDVPGIKTEMGLGDNYKHNIDAINASGWEEAQKFYEAAGGQEYLLDLPRVDEFGKTQPTLRQILETKPLQDARAGAPDYTGQEFDPSTGKYRVFEDVASLDGPIQKAERGARGGAKTVDQAFPTVQPPEVKMIMNQFTGALESEPTKRIPNPNQLSAGASEFEKIWEVPADWEPPTRPAPAPGTRSGRVDPEYWKSESRNLGITVNEPAPETMKFETARDINQAANRQMEGKFSGINPAKAGPSIDAGTLADFRRALDEQIPEYGEGRKVYETKQQVVEAADYGLNFLKHDSEEILDIVEGYNKSQRQGFILGVMQGLKDKLGSAGDTTQAIKKLIGSENNRAKLRAAFGKEGEADYKKLMDVLKQEETFSTSFSTIGKGSQTSFREEAKRVMGMLSGEQSKWTKFSTVLDEGVLGNPFRAALKGSQLVQQMINKDMLPPEVGLELAKMLTEKGMTKEQVQKMLTDPMIKKYGMFWQAMKSGATKVPIYAGTAAATDE